MGTQSFQKKSPRSSAKSKQDTSERPDAFQHRFGDHDEDEQYMDGSLDHVARVRAAKEAAQREMESFGDVSDYEITIIQGQLKEEPPATQVQIPLSFRKEAQLGSGDTD